MTATLDPSRWTTAGAFAADVAAADPATQPALAFAAFNHMAELTGRDDYDQVASLIETMPEHWLAEPLRSRWLLAGAHAVMHSTNPQMSRHRAIMDRFSAACVTPFLAEHPRLAPRRRVRSRLAIGFFGSILRRTIYAERGLRTLIGALDRRQFEIHAMALGTDDLPAASWLGAEVTHALGDEAAAAHHLRALGLDVLVYMDGVSPNMPWRLLTRRVAPWQVAWFHAHLTFGAIGMDYQIADPQTIPANQRQWYTEPVLDMPVLSNCYSLIPLYAGQRLRQPSDPTTFGSFNRLTKISVACATAWAEILTRLPTARLMIFGESVNVPDAHRALIDRLAACGVPLARVAFDGGQADAEFFAHYGEVDLVLDTFPFAGGLTSFECLSQGTPILTLEGPELVQRQTACLLRLIDRAELITTSVEEYVATAVAFAQAPERLDELRQDLRSRVAHSSVCDHQRFAREFGAILLAVARDPS